MPEIAQRVWDRAESILAAMSVDLVDIEIAGNRRNRVLRVTIDRPSGVDLDLCEEVSGVLGSLFEEVDPVPGSYVLEVSSPGLERRLRTEQHWVRSVGETVRAKLAGGEGTVQGRLESVDAGRVTVATDDGERVEIPLDGIATGQTVFEWDGN